MQLSLAVAGALCSNGSHLCTRHRVLITGRRPSTAGLKSWTSGSHRRSMETFIHGQKKNGH
jgi:hypothetical protein